LNSLNNQFQIIGLTETWLNDNYDFVNVNRSNKIGGGVGIYITNQIKYKLCTDLNTSIENVIESVFIEIITAVGKNIIVSLIYRPPNNKIDLYDSLTIQLH
jgi:hypothetical protein